MKRFIVTLFMLTAALFISGCYNGLLFYKGLYTHTVEPLTFNREPTAVTESESEAQGVINQVSSAPIPIAPISYAVNVRIGKNGLGDVAREHGLQTIYYADIERWTAGFGLYSREVVHIYGR